MGQFDTWAEFIAMGKHGKYVWAAYGVFALIMAGNILAVAVHKRAVIKQIKKERKWDDYESNS